MEIYIAPKRMSLFTEFVQVVESLFNLILQIDLGDGRL